MGSRATLKVFSFLLVSVCLAAAPSVVAEEPPAPAEEPVSIMDRIDFARGLYARNMYDMAAEEFKSLLAEHPDHPEIHHAYYGSAESLFLLGRYAEAYEGFKTYLAKFPRQADSDKARKRAAEALYFTGRLKAARLVFERLIDNPAPEVQTASEYYLGKIHYEEGRPEEAYPHFRAVFEGDGKNPFGPYAAYYLGEIVLEKGEAAEAARYFAKITEKDHPELKQLSYFGLGKSAFSGGRFDEAAGHFRKAYELPEDPELTEDAFLNFLSALFNLESFDRLIDGYVKEGKKISSQERKSRMELLAAQAYARSGRHKEAMKLYEKLVASENLSAEETEEAWLSMAESLMEQGETDFALKVLDGMDLKRVLKPDHVLYLKARVLKRAGRTAEALKVLEDFMVRFAESDLSDQVYVDRAYLYLELDRLPEAREAMRVFLARFRDRSIAPKVFSDMILISVRLEEFERAAEESERFLSQFKSAPEAEKVHYRLGSLLSEAGDYEMAHQTYEKHLKRYGKSADRPRVYSAMGYNLQRSGDFARALKYYDRVKKEEVDSELYFEVLKNTAHCHVNMEHYDEAAAIYWSMIADYPGQKVGPEIFFWMADRYAREGKGERLEVLLQEFRKKHEPAAYGSQFAFYLGESHRMAGNYPMALRYYDDCIQRNLFFKPNAYLGRGICLAAGQKWKESEEAFGEALRLAQEDHELAVRVRTEMGNALRLKGDYLGAAKAFFAIAILYDDELAVPPALMQAGELFVKGGNKKHAIQAYQELLERFGTHPLAQRAGERLKELTT